MKQQFSRTRMQIPALDEGSPSPDEGAQSSHEGQQLSMLNHAVQFYEDDAFLIDAVKAFVLEGLHASEPIAVFMTPAHKQLMEQALGTEEARGALPRGASRKVLYHDADETMQKFMMNGWPEEQLFMAVIGQILQPLFGDRPVRVFGEMVCVLWGQSRYRAALRLEELWNALIGRHSLCLLCAYCITGFRGKGGHESYRQVCDLHHHVHPDSRAA
jgi:hypothetical protein